MIEATQDENAGDDSELNGFSDDVTITKNHWGVTGVRTLLLPRFQWNLLLA